MTHQDLIMHSRTHMWLPFTQMHDYDRNPLVITRGDGIMLYDTEDRAYYDACSSIWLNVHGHRHPALDHAIRTQLDAIAHTTLLGMTNAPAVSLAVKLVALAPPGLTRVYYSDSGATAVEIALKMAFQYWQNIGKQDKKTFVTLEGSYHGDTIGAVSVGNIDLFHALYRPLLFPCERVPFPDTYRNPYGTTDACRDACLAHIEQLFAASSDHIAAIVVESLVQGASGMRIMPEGFLHGIRALCDAYDVLLICDEVATGFGRTGAMFACMQESVVPDIMTIGKGLTGGYLPIAATLTTEKIYTAFYGSYTYKKTLFHGHSYTGNALGCAVALANIDVMEREHVLDHVRTMTAHVADILHTFWELPAVGDIRQKGLMIGIELTSDRATKRPFDPNARIGYETTLRMRARGLLARPLGDTIVYMPPLCTTAEQHTRMLDIMYAAIREAPQ